MIPRNCYRSKHIGLMIFTVLFSTFATSIPTISSLQFFTATGTTPVMGTKQKYLWGDSNYTFSHDSSIIFEAPTLIGWTFDHTEIDFGCHVIQVTGTNITNVFAITNGSIATCARG